MQGVVLPSSATATTTAVVAETSSSTAIKGGSKSLKGERVDAGAEHDEQEEEEGEVKPDVEIVPPKEVGRR